MVAVERARVQEYSKLQPEPDVGNDENLPKNWPSKSQKFLSNIMILLHYLTPIQENEKVGFQDLIYLTLVYQCVCNGL